MHLAGVSDGAIGKFQSAPLTGARGDHSGDGKGYVYVQFQSAPLTGARGDGSIHVRRSRPRVVSIRSPHRSEGRCLGRLQAPLGEVRFNPLPSPERGEMGTSLETPCPSCVSIRSPHRSEGRCFVVDGVQMPPEFQSAPLTGARGDAAAGDIRHRTTVNVSIRSPHRSEGRCWPAGSRTPRPPCFNPLPSPERGEICSIRRGPKYQNGFNPLPSPERGEMWQSI